MGEWYIGWRGLMGDVKVGVNGYRVERVNGRCEGRG